MYSDNSRPSFEGIGRRIPSSENVSFLCVNRDVLQLEVNLPQEIIPSLNK